ncbi:hypothetical protein QFC22_001015 [Naganishia vaughanmartiniae]|uniref:Uncharacterized protein n=1 Tax=Naganishia vaughanmartiniae TaxID=1424756 RepID=A0ACC2XND2_9TREE|nr:hypothetical protein QFC22_001015 [Naganishia vaughanmartiniae]
MASRTSAFRALWRQVAASATRPHVAITGSALTTGVVLANYMHDRPSILPERLTVYADSERTSPILDLSNAKDAFVVDPATSISFPQTLKSLALPGSSLSLVGLGVRTVSFLRVKVYSAGFYLEDSALQSLRNQAEWKHLRDGFTRALLARQKRAVQEGKLKPEDEERIDAAIQQFKSFFPSSSVPKGKELLLVKTAQNSLAVEFEGKTLGTLQNAWVATEMMAAYFANKNVISAPLKEDVARNLESAIRG